MNSEQNAQCTKNNINNLLYAILTLEKKSLKCKTASCFLKYQPYIFISHFAILF